MIARWAVRGKCIWRNFSRSISSMKNLAKIVMTNRMKASTAGRLLLTTWAWRFSFLPNFFSFLPNFRCSRCGEQYNTRREAEKCLSCWVREIQEDVDYEVPEVQKGDGSGLQ